MIESSGVARPVSVAETFFNPAVQHLVELQNMITLLDADLVIDDQADYSDLAYAQVAVADLVVINKTDLVSPRQIEDVRQISRGHCARCPYLGNHFRGSAPRFDL